MSNYKHNFVSSLRNGKAGEAALQALALTCNINLTQTDGRSGDFVDADGHKWEVKSDSYDAKKTSNFFIERYSNVSKGTNGGPYQALEHGCKYFVYFFPLNKLAYVFDTQDLVTQLEKVSLGKPIEIHNTRHTTIGFKVLRASLKPLYVLEKGAKLEAV